jgi:hypothetical protein
VLRTLLLLCACLPLLSCGDDSGTGDDTDSDSGEIVCSLGTLDGDMPVDEKHELAFLAGFTSITGDLEIHELGFSTHLGELTCLTSVGGSLTIRDCGLVSLKGLSSLSAIGGDLVIDETTVPGLDSLEGLTAINGDLVLSEVGLLLDVDGMDNITAIGGDLRIAGMYYFANLDGLSSLTSVGGDLELHQLEEIRSLDGLSGVSYIGGSLSVEHNEDLRSVRGLEGISSLGNDLVLEGNDRLQNLEGLSSLTILEGSLTVRHNDYLPDCKTCAFLEQLTTGPSTILVEQNLEDPCTPVPDGCSFAHDPCPGYTGSDPCCQNSNPCELAIDGNCDCDITCMWDFWDCAY